MFVISFSACNCDAEGSDGETCDDNGLCSCKANIINEKCDACNAGYFNFPTCEGKHFFVLQVVLPPPFMLAIIAFFQISACNCNEHGSNSIDCNDNGVCSCKANIINDKCDTCQAGLFNFPTCEGK